MNNTVGYPIFSDREACVFFLRNKNKISQYTEVEFFSNVAQDICKKKWYNLALENLPKHATQSNYIVNACKNDMIALSENTGLE